MERSRVIDILIVEDSEDDLYFIKKTLAGYNYNVQAISTGSEALEFLLSPPKKPDIVLLDNHLPNFSGIEILEKLGDITSNYGIIFLTVDNTIDVVVKAMRAGAMDFLVKSLNLKSELPEKIIKVFEIHRNRIEKQELQANFKSIIEASDDLIWAIDKNFQLTACNKNFRDEIGRLFGLSIETNSSLLNNVNSNLKIFWLDKFNSVLEGKRKVFNYEHKTKESISWFEIKLNPIEKNGCVIGVSGIARDITENRNAELELIAAKERAEESDSLKTAFLQNISHEIRTPLNVICGLSGLLDNQNLSIEKRKQFVDIIRINSDQLISIVNDIITVSSLETKQEEVKVDKVCINNLVSDLAKKFLPQVENRNIKFQCVTPLANKKSEVYTDGPKVLHILSSLLSNAVKFTNDGFIEFGYRINGNEIEFFVKDSGIGIPLDIIDKVFQRFWQADQSMSRAFGGTGLGLAIAKGLVELLGGRIWVESVPQNGSTFNFSIPYNPVLEEQKIAEIKAAKTENRTILVAEDEEFNFIYIEELLKEMDFNVVHARNGREAVEISNSNPNIDAILMDIKMPLLDGHAAAKMLKESNFNKPIIAQSAYALQHEIVRYSDAFDDYLTKPLKKEKLAETFSKFFH